jgi:uracil-DNA glycosylase
VIQVSINNDFSSWRHAARALLAQGAKPAEVLWTESGQNALFDAAANLATSPSERRISRSFIQLGEAVACHSDPTRWQLLYSLLFRLANENRHLLEIESDPEVRQARLMEKAVNRDVHKFHAFVRFRRLEIDGTEVFIAWHEPQHFTVERASPFFMRRFGEMRFSILTPHGCAHWDKENLVFSEAVDRSRAPNSDEMEDFWLLYYRSIFNPFRLKVRTMKKELPIRHWATLPEAVLIPELVRQAGEPTVSSANSEPAPLLAPGHRRKSRG